MSINDYTSVNVQKRNISASHFLTHHLEPFLLSMMVLAGVIGSSYIFGEKLINDSTTAINELKNGPEKSALASLFISNEEEKSSTSFNDYVAIDKKIESGKDFVMTFLKDERASRYVMEMGDGVRLIITQKNLVYQYKEPGTYYIELKEIKDGLLNIVGTKKIKVK